MKLVWKGSTGCVMAEFEMGSEDAEWDAGRERIVEQASREFFSLMTIGDTLTLVGDAE